MKKVLIIGCPGSGKSTFSTKLARLTSLPLYHLDFYRHDASKKFRDNPDNWAMFINKICQKDEWIMDGNYTNSLELRIQNADTIIFFDYPKTISLHRLLKRRIYFNNKKRSDMPDNWNEKLKLRFIKFVWDFNKIQRPKIYRILNKYKSGRNFLVFKRPSEAEEWLRSITINH